MQGQQALGGDLAQAALIVDLQLAGVRVECGEVVFPWFLAEKPEDLVTVAPPVVAIERVVEQAAERAVEKVVGPVAAGRVWRAGVGETVVVIQGDRPLEGEALGLLERMLAAVGLGPEVGTGVVWVGAVGKVGQDDVLQEILAVQPQRVLILGQGMLGVLLGKTQGVEGWQVAPMPLKGMENMRVGVTYPVELLLGQPLFKRLAWQHLLAWRDW